MRPEPTREDWARMHEIPSNIAKREAAWSEAMAKAAEMLFKTGVPRRAISVHDKAQETPALLAVSDPFGMLVLSGQPGVGKTVAAAAWMAGFYHGPKQWTREAWLDYKDGEDSIAYQYRFKGGNAIWTTASALARVDHYGEGIVELTNASRLVIDDLGAEFLDAKGFFLSTLDEVLNERYANERPTLMTTNLDAAGFKSRYGERVADRIREAGRFVGCGTKSLRGAV